MADPKFKNGDKVIVPFHEATSPQTRKIVGEFIKYTDDALLISLPFGIAALYEEKDVEAG